MSGTRLGAVLIAAVAGAISLSSCASSPVPAMDREQTADDAAPSHITWPEEEPMDPTTSRLLGHDRDGREYFVARSSNGSVYCLSVVPAATDAWVTVCSSLPLTAEVDGVEATLVHAGFADGGDEIIGDQVVVDYVG